MMRCVMEPNLLSAQRAAASVLWMRMEEGVRGVVVEGVTPVLEN